MAWLENVGDFDRISRSSSAADQRVYIIWTTPVRRVLRNASQNRLHCTSWRMPSVGHWTNHLPIWNLGGWPTPAENHRGYRLRCRMPSVLVVDDQDQVRQLIRETLEQAGYDVEEARDGKEGLDLYRTRSTDLVIMDILMPDQDGLETIMTLHREFPDARVIAMTGGSDAIGVLNFLGVAKMLGARRTLQKPFELKVLLDTVAAELTV